MKNPENSNKTSLNEAFKEISPTAILTAYPRTFSDIPYYPEIFAAMRRAELSISEDLLVSRLAPELEARHKLIDKLLSETGACQVLEVAAGFSPRGINFVQNRRSAQYVELDLPDVAKTKRDILNSIVEVPENLHILGGNALEGKDFERATAFFDPDKPVAVVNEGLLRYLTFAEKAKLAENIRAVLSKFGGVWITGDGATRQFGGESRTGSTNQTILTNTKRQDLGNAFESQAHMAEFFGGLGFGTDFHPFTEVQDELVSPKKLNFSDEEVTSKLLAYADVVVMRVEKEVKE
ncbi:MAG: class I SAM-dependent methyltransferase [Candidatus Nomurabacteria bacterium]|jgi:O-methyltransferase involved in polyketide biosynthesis|nr:class I SAM-dependent methyltransferase [Candidatus Nomurabacteria bacterium]